MVHRIPLIVNASANQIQELPANDTLAGGIPLGGIIMWSGNASSTSVPTGFVLCDGNVNNGGAAINGITIPDLTNRFIIGANQVDGGVWKGDIETGTYSGSNIAKQSGGFKNSVLHTHEHKYAFAQGSGGGITDTNNGSSGITNVTSFGGSLSELEQSGGSDGQDLQGFTAESEEVGVNRTGGDSNSQTGCDANLPPYFALAYIIRVS